MKNLIIVLALVTSLTFAVSAQSKDCCSKEKCETTKVEKSLNTDQTMKSGDKVETTTAAALTSNKKIIENETEVSKTKMDKMEKCDKNTSCCDMKKVKETEKVEKEVKKEIEKK